MITGLHVERVGYIPGMGTFGQLAILGSDFRCLTVEREWANNEDSKSCIPEGTYPLVRGIFYGDENRGPYETFCLEEVGGRSLIKIHIANAPLDVKGCIGLGSRWGYIKSQWAVLASADTHREFMLAMEGVDDTTIEIGSISQGGGPRVGSLN